MHSIHTKFEALFTWKIGAERFSIQTLQSSVSRSRNTAVELVLEEGDDNGTLGMFAEDEDEARKTREPKEDPSPEI